MAEAIRARTGAILAANALDLAEARAAGQTAAFIDRLLLDEARLAGVADAVAGIASLPDPLGRVLTSWTQPNGLRFERVATPLGVIAVIFESRPNVTADAGALCLKRQRGDPARRLRQFPDLDRDRACLARGADGGRPSGGCDPARPEPRPGRRRRNPERS